MIVANAEEIKKMDGIAEEHTQQLIQRILHVMTLKIMIDNLKKKKSGKLLCGNM